MPQPTSSVTDDDELEPQWAGTIADGVPTASVRTTYPSSTNRRQLIISLLESEFERVDVSERPGEEGTQFTITGQYECFTEFPPSSPSMPLISIQPFTTEPSDAVLTVASAFGMVVTGINVRQTLDDVALYQDGDRIESFESEADDYSFDPGSYTLRLAGRSCVQIMIHDVTGDGFREQTEMDPRHPPHPDV
jgi:hypothetical protein